MWFRLVVSTVWYYSCQRLSGCVSGFPRHQDFLRISFWCRSLRWIWSIRNFTSSLDIKTRFLLMPNILKCFFFFSQKFVVKILFVFSVKAFFVKHLVYLRQSSVLRPCCISINRATSVFVLRSGGSREYQAFLFVCVCFCCGSGYIWLVTGSYQPCVPCNASGARRRKQRHKLPCFRLCCCPEMKQPVIL